MLSRDETGRRRTLTNDGRKVAKDNGVKFGPKFKLTAHQQQEAREMLEEGKSLREVGRTFNVNASTIMRLKD